MKKSIAIALLFSWVITQGQTQSNYDLTAANGNGFRFWNGSNSYKIHMGIGAEYSYGPVTGYSIKNNMNNTAGRGWTWGISGQTPIAALNNVGDFQVERNFYALGKVGIGTSNPLDKLTVKGHVNIGDDGNYHLRVRHVNGKSHVSRDLGSLYLNYNTGQKVLIGWGNTTPASDLVVAGRLGIGTTSPSHHIDVINEHQTTESFLRFRVKDATSDYFQIANSTSAPGQFIPIVKGHRVSDNRYSIQFIGQTSETNDSGGNALVNFDARRNNGPVQTRPLFVWTSYADKKMTMLANGNLGIGTSSPDSKLAVNGDIHAKEVKVDLVGWPDYVFKEGYDLPTLEEIQRHIKEKGHLPNIPSANEVEENGVQLGEMNKLLLEKIEELTLYALEQEKKIQNLQNQNKGYQLIMERLEKIERNLKSLGNEN